MGRFEIAPLRWSASINHESAADHGGFDLKQELLGQARSTTDGHSTPICVRCFHLTIKPKPCTQVQGQVNQSWDVAQVLPKYFASSKVTWFVPFSK
jgi:hypothetical protein